MTSEDFVVDGECRNGRHAPGGIGKHVKFLLVICHVYLGEWDVAGFKLIANQAAGLTVFHREQRNRVILSDFLHGKSVVFFLWKATQELLTFFS